MFLDAYPTALAVGTMSRNMGGWWVISDLSSCVIEFLFSRLVTDVETCIMEWVGRSCGGVVVESGTVCSRSYCSDDVSILRSWGVSKRWG